MNVPFINGFTHPLPPSSLSLQWPKSDKRNINFLFVISQQAWNCHLWHVKLDFTGFYILFPVISKKKKKSNVLHFNNYNSGSKHDFQHFLNILTIFFHLLFELYLLIYLIFAFQELQNFISGVPHLFYVLVCKVHTYLPVTIWRLLT